jgi:hypothetical protein
MDTPGACAIEGQATSNVAQPDRRADVENAAKSTPALRILQGRSAAPVQDLGAEK